jgi:hypothetical protein
MKRPSLLAMSFLFTLACNGDKVPTAPIVPAAPAAATSVSVSVVSSVQTVAPGQTARLTATARYTDGSTKDVTSQATWTSSLTTVATVSAGAVTGVTLGRTLIRVLFDRWASSKTIVVEPDGTYILKGTVTEPGGIAVSGATVEAISGSQGQTVTNSTGAYELLGMGGTFILRVGKTGYFDERRTVTMSADQSLDVDITPRSAPAAVAGLYRVTFTVPPGCTALPAELKTRTYTAQIDQDAARVLVTLSGAPFVSRKNTFSGKVAGDIISFDLGTGDFYYYYYGGVVQEMVSSNQILTIWGTLTAPVTPQSISGSLAGGFTLRTVNNRAMSCSAADGRVVFTRQ